MCRILIILVCGMTTCPSLLWGDFVSPTSASSAAFSSIGNPMDLITDAASSSYQAPNPSGGGGGTSWWTEETGSSSVNLDFDFADAESLGGLYVWDYYHHSPSHWNLKLFDGANGSGNQLLNFDFSISPGPHSNSTKHYIDFADQAGVASGSLTTLNDSTGGGVGLSEFGFASVPEPTSPLLMAGMFGAGVACRRKRVKTNR